MSYTLALLADVGGGEMLIIGVVALLLFGKNLPTVSRNIGKAIGEFKKTLGEASSEIRKEMNNAAESMDKVVKDAKVDEAVGALQQSVNEATAEAPYDPDTYAASSSTSSGTDTSTATASSTTATTSPATSTSTATEPTAETLAARAAALDTLERNIRPPSKIPPPVM